MFKNVASQSVTVLAIDTATGTPKTGDASNITLYYNGDGGGVTIFSTGSGHPSEDDATNSPGTYTIAMTQGETNYNRISVSGKSSTSGIRIIPILNIQTVPANFPALAITSGGIAQADIQTIKTQTVTCAAGVTVNANVGTTQPINFTGTGATSYVKVDVVDWGGAAAPAQVLSRIPSITTFINGTVASGSTSTTANIATGLANDSVTGQTLVVQLPTGGAFQSRLITGYVSSTGVATVDHAWTETPTVGQSYYVVPAARVDVGLVLGTASAGAAGYVGVDWGQVTNKTTTNALTGTTIASTQQVDVNTIKTNPVVNGGTITFPTGATLASTTNITAGTITTVTTATNVTTVNGLASGVITATSIAASALNGKGDWLLSSSYTTPPTTAQIATAVWTDTTGSDFTTLTSPGKVIFAQLGGAFTTTSSSVFTTAALANAPTGGSAPTTAQIATAVWQDTTAGDFTTAGSIGKSLFTSGNAPGAASGLALVGSNVGTATSVTAAVTIDATQAVPTSNTANTVGDCLNAARAQGFGKWTVVGTTLTLYAADGTTAVRTFTLDSATAPTSRT